MKFSPQNILLKDGRIVLLRHVEVSDAAEVIEFVHGFVYDEEYVPLSEGEFNPSLAEEEQDLANYINRSNSLFLVAEYKGKLVANINVNGSQRQILRHTAVFGMGMHKEWQSCGLGTAILKAAIEWARTSELEILILQVYAENQAGLALYRKMGFVENGRIPNFFKQNGRYHDEISMHLSVK